jgi:hypothetical protein
MYSSMALDEWAINSPNGGKVEGGAKTGPEWAGPAGLGPFWPNSAPASSRVVSRVIPYLCALACGPLALFPSQLRLECLPSKLRCFLVESLKICKSMLRSSGHLESCSSRVLTLIGFRIFFQSA